MGKFTKKSGNYNQYLKCNELQRDIFVSSKVEIFSSIFFSGSCCAKRMCKFLVCSNMMYKFCSTDRAVVSVGNTHVSCLHVSRLKVVVSYFVFFLRLLLGFVSFPFYPCD